MSDLAPAAAATVPAGPSLRDIQDAALRMAGRAVRTPLLESPHLNHAIGGRLLIKAEPLQRTGSFKFRGAFNRIACIPPERIQAGVVAYSSGNHGQAVAAVARMYSIPATIIMPADAPAMKRRATESWGAKIVAYDRTREDREAIGAAIAAETGATIVPPYDDPLVIAGQGTVGLELADQAKSARMTPDAVLVCCGGGGLIAGVATALAAKLPGVPVYAVEPAGFDDTARSLAAGERLANSAATGSLCDALMAPMPGAVTFPINRRLLKGGLAVSDDEVLAAMAAAFEHLKLVVEPGGAAALAAALSGKIETRDKQILVVCTGGNVDPAIYARALEKVGPVA